MRRLSFSFFLLLLVAVLLLDGGLCEEQEGVVAPMDKAEQDALYTLLQGFVGSWWNGSALYPDPCGWTPIQGVSCDIFDGVWYITGLNIGPVLENSLNCSDTADFTPSQFSLKHLRTLSIFGCFTNHITNIPSLGWNKLSSTLETLEFRSNPGLTGEIPPPLSQLTSLRSLVLVENSLTGEIPEEIGGLVRLKRLSLEGNKLSGHVPASLCYNLSSLLILDLSRNYLTGTLPSSLGSLTSLLKLDLSSNQLSGRLPEEFGNMKSLTLLDLRANNLTGGLISQLQQMASLQDVLLGNNPYFGGNLMGFEFDKLINLTNLDLSNTGLNGLIPNSIAKLNGLRSLALDNNHLRGVVPAELEALSSLHTLHLNGNNLSGELEFSDEFYRRIGTRFACWSNPGLCYRNRGASKSNAPLGMGECGSEKKDYELNSNKKTGEDSDSGSVAASSALSGKIGGRFWGVVLVQEMVAVLLLLVL